MMGFAVWTAAALLAILMLFHWASIFALLARQRRVPARAAEFPPVSLVRPVCGIENYIEPTLRSSFRLDYPAYEILFCVARPDDPVIGLVRRLIAEYPQVPAQLLIGDDPVSANPKLNNCIKGWDAATHNWIVLADSNVLMPPDYLQRMFGSWRADTGLVCAPPVGGFAEGFWAEMECAFLNAYQARAQYFADTLGLGFAQGKSMLWRREVLARAGGIRALAAEIAEDAAATKIVRAQGLRVRLVDTPFRQPLGRRRAAEVWSRQVRWARLRRATFPLFYVPEILGGALLPFALIAALALIFDAPLGAALLAFATLWYGGEFFMLRRLGWPAPPLYPVQALLRDLLIPALWISGWRDRGFVWRGNHMHVAQASEAASHSKG